MKKLIVVFVGFLLVAGLDKISFASDLRNGAMGDVSLGIWDPHSQALVNPAKAIQIERMTIYLDGGDIYTSSWQSTDQVYDNTPPYPNCSLKFINDNHSNQWGFPIVCFVPFGRFVLGGKFNYTPYNSLSRWITQQQGIWVGSTYNPSIYFNTEYRYENNASRRNYGAWGAFKISNISLGLCGNFDDNINYYTYNYNLSSNWLGSDSTTLKRTDTYFKNDYRGGAVWNLTKGIEISFLAALANSQEKKSETESTRKSTSQPLITILRTQNDQNYTLEGRFNLGEVTTMGTQIGFSSSMYTDSTGTPTQTYNSGIGQSYGVPVGLGLGFRIDESTLLACDFLITPWSASTYTQYNGSDTRTSSS